MKHSATVEQICQNSSPAQRKWWKRYAAKLMRRLAKLDADDAPRRLPLRGYDT